MPTASLAPGHVQANLVVLPETDARDFETLCARNPQPLPLLEKTVAGSSATLRVAADTDLQTDLPKYRVYRNGALSEERTDLTGIWQSDWVGFLLGCSFTFDALLVSAGLRVAHLETQRNVPMYITNQMLSPSGPMRGPLVVSMRPVHPSNLDRVVELTTSIPLAHGAPIQIGDPEGLGIDLDKPDFGDPPAIQTDELPVFWACGVTSQAVALQSQLPWMVTHAPGHMFVTDLHVSDLIGLDSLA